MHWIVGVEKGSTLPITISRILFTITDNQASAVSIIYYGDNETADLNKKMPNFGTNKYPGGVQINGLPLKPEGEAKMKIIFTIDIYGILNVKFYSLDNGNSDNYTVDIKGLLDDYQK